MIQLYAKMDDLRPSEYPNLSVDEKWYEMFTKEGIKDSIRIRPDGYITRGNTRYDWTVKFGRELFLPIDLGYYLGLCLSKEKTITMRREVLQKEIMKGWDNKCRPIHPPNKIHMPPNLISGDPNIDPIYSIEGQGAILHDLVQFETIYPEWVLRGI